jgi:hypothetical protein
MVTTGKHAYVDGIPCVTSWGVNITNTAARHAASCVPDATAVVEGNLDWGGGTITGIGYNPAAMPTGTAIPFLGIVNRTGVDAGQALEGDILIEELTINIPVNAGTNINWAATFGVQGELLAVDDAADADALDATFSQGASAKDGKISIDDGSGFSVRPGVQNITLVFRRPHATYVENGLTLRQAGNLEAEVSYDVVSDEFLYDYDAPNATNLLRAYVTSLLFWEFDNIVFGGRSNFTINRQDNSLVGYSVNGLWTAVTGSTQGHINKPGGSFLYGS